jgi:hypothetical protein
MVSQKRISEQRRMVTIVCIFRERRNESSLPAARLARVSEAMRPKSIAM